MIQCNYTTPSNVAETMIRKMKKFTKIHQLSVHV